MRTLVVVPTYNEAATIHTVIEAVDSQAFELLVVDDGSPDGTAELVERASEERDGVHLLRRTSKDGLGSAYRAGFAWALEQDRYDIVCQMDADLSHDPYDLQRLVTAVREGCDVAIGSRYVPGGATVGWPRTRELLSKGGNTYMRMATGVGVKDMTAGFRAWRTTAVEELGLCATESEGYSFQLETTALTWRDGKRVTEVPIVFTERTEGESKMDSSIVLEALWRVLVLGWRIRRPEVSAPKWPVGQRSLRQAAERHSDTSSATGEPAQNTTTAPTAPAAPAGPSEPSEPLEPSSHAPAPSSQPSQPSQPEWIVDLRVSPARFVDGSPEPREADATAAESPVQRPRRATP